jgi:hypothetical protein
MSLYPGFERDWARALCKLEVRQHLDEFGLSQGEKVTACLELAADMHIEGGSPLVGKRHVGRTQSKQRWLVVIVACFLGLLGLGWLFRKGASCKSET